MMRSNSKLIMVSMVVWFYTYKGSKLNLFCAPIYHRAHLVGCEVDVGSN